MSPAQSRKAARKGQPARKAARKAARPKAGAPKRASPKPAGSAPRSASAAGGHAHCAASDPFGDACQNLPRRPSKYCVIHSYLER